MFSTLIVVGFIFGLACLQQQYLNRLMAADLKYLETLCAERTKDYSPGKSRFQETEGASTSQAAFRKTVSAQGSSPSFINKQMF